MILLPEEIIREILSYAPDYHDNLLRCHRELLKNRPCYYRKSILGFSPGIEDSPTWHNFTNRKNLEYWRQDEGGISRVALRLKPYAIEITAFRPRSGRNWHTRDMYIYYGWARENNEHFWREILGAEGVWDLKPGYY